MKYGKGPPQQLHSIPGKRLRDVTLTLERRGQTINHHPLPWGGGKKPCKALEKLLGQQGHGNQPSHETGMEEISQRVGGCVFV